MWGNIYHRDMFLKAFQSGLLHTSYCFFGDEGVGKTTTAYEIASYIETGEFDAKNVIDSRIFIPNEKKAFGIDEVREIKEFCSNKPLRSKRRIAIIKFETITEYGQSALLKLIEEPPESTLIIIVVKNKDILFPPLLSRLHTIYFPRYTRKQVVDFLVETKKINGKIAENIAQLSFGSLGRALTILDGENDDETHLPSYISSLIREYYIKGVVTYSSLLKKLLKKETELNEFTLNNQLQKRAIQYFKSKV